MQERGSVDRRGRRALEKVAGKLSARVASEMRPEVWDKALELPSLLALGGNDLLLGNVALCTPLPHSRSLC